MILWIHLNEQNQLLDGNGDRIVVMARGGGHQKPSAKVTCWFGKDEAMANLQRRFPESAIRDLGDAIEVDAPERSVEHWANGTKTIPARTLRMIQMESTTAI